MTIFARYRETPSSSSGRFVHDPLLVLADAVMSGLWALSGLFKNAMALPASDRVITLQVAERHLVASDQDVVAVTLIGVKTKQLPPWTPGAHIDIHLPSGRVRQYSLCGDPAQRNVYRIAVRRIPDGGGGSTEIHEALHVDAIVTTGGPRNAFPLTVPGSGSFSQRLRFIAGGIGITPILPMLGYAEALGVDRSLV